jgi:hypothetical protein
MKKLMIFLVCVVIIGGIIFGWYYFNFGLGGKDKILKMSFEKKDCTTLGADKNYLKIMEIASSSLDSIKNGSQIVCAQIVQSGQPISIISASGEKKEIKVSEFNNERGMFEVSDLYFNLQPGMASDQPKPLCGAAKFTILKNQLVEAGTCAIDDSKRWYLTYQ